MILYKTFFIKVRNEICQVIGLLYCYILSKTFFGLVLFIIHRFYYMNEPYSKKKLFIGLLKFTAI